jgi:2-hydroxychromene-2-carboxylate isomerase
MGSIDFYFDFVSPYAFIASRLIHSVAARHERTVALRPILFAALLDANGNKGPAEIPPKRVYTFKDAYRKAHRAGLGKLVPPPSHPFNPLIALRASALPDIETKKLVDALFDAAWTQGIAIDSAEAIATIATRAGLDGEAIAKAAQSPEAKERLRNATNEAIARGVFGVPTMIADGEPFWGTDGLEHLDVFLRGDDPLPKDLSWAARPASASRKGSRS